MSVPSHHIQVHDLTIDVKRREVSRNSDPINLAKLSFELLIFLISNAEQACSIKSIAMGVWKDTNVSDETVTQRIRLLRQSLGDDSKNPTYIESVRGFGYKLIAAVSFLDEPNLNQTQTSETIKTTHSKQKPDTDSIYPDNNLLLSLYTKEKRLSKSLSKKTVIIFSAFIAVLSIIVIGYFYHQNNKVLNKSSSNIKSLVDPLEALLQRGQYYQKIAQEDDLKRAENIYRSILKRTSVDVDSQLSIDSRLGLSITLSYLVCRFQHPNELTKEAQTLAEKITEQRPSWSPAWGALGFAWDCQGNLEKALSSYLKAIELDVDDLHGRSAAAHLLEKKGDIVRSLQWSLMVKNNLNNVPLTELQIARALELLGFISSSEALHQKLFMLYPDMVFINEALPRFYLSRGQLKKARSAADEAFKRNASRTFLQSYYAEIIWVLEGKDQAMPWFKKAMHKHPDKSFASTIYHLLNNSMSQTEGQKHLVELQRSIDWGDRWPETFMEKVLIEWYVMKNEEQSMATLKAMIDSGFLDSGYLKHSPLFAQMKNHQSFQKLLDIIDQKRFKMKEEVMEAQWLPMDLITTTTNF